MAKQEYRGIPDIESSVIQSWNPHKKIYYNNNHDIKNFKVNMHLTPRQVEEYRKCANDPKYFITNYTKIQDLEKGFIYFDMYDFQHDMLDIFHNNRFSIFNCCRQIGKCDSFKTIINICKKPKNVKRFVLKLINRELYEEMFSV